MRIASGKRIRMADSGLRPAKNMVKMIKQVAMELREAKKPLAVESRPITARAIEARPMNGDRNWLSRVVFQEKSGKKATLILSIKPPSERPGAQSSSGMMFGLTKAATTRAARPMSIINRVKMSGMVGKVLIVKRRCGCKSANKTMKAARYIRWGVKIAARSAKAKTKQYIGFGLVTP